MIRGQNSPKHGGQTAFFRMKTHSAGEMFGRGGGLHYVRNLSTPRSERIDTTFRTYQHYVPKPPSIRSEPIDTTFRTYPHYVPNLSALRSEPITTTF